MTKKYLWIVLLIATQLACGVQHADSGTRQKTNNGKEEEPVQKSNAGKLVKPKGLYVINRLEGKLPESCFTDPGIDGMFLRYHWNEIQPTEKNFDWTALDADFQKAIQNHKKIELSVVAGGECPDWIYTKGIPKLHFTEATRNFYGKTIDYDLPAFWKEEYKVLWKNLITQLAAHINSKPGYMDAITLVKLNGINSKSEEMKLPQEVNVEKENGRSTGDHRTIWANAGYRPSSVINTWKEFADVIAEQFPNCYIGLALVIPKQGFPDVDENGRSASENNTQQMLLDAAVKKFPDRLAVNFTALRAKGGTPEFIKELHAKGVVTGYQLFGQFINPPCIKTNNCDDEELKAAFVNGFNNNADFIEVFYQTLKAYPGAIKYAKKEYDKKSND
ncbi:MAG: hypothetical protein ABI723_08240 [Bacteroidia bacterium]